MRAAVVLLLIGCGRFGFVSSDSPRDALADGDFTGGVIDAPDGALPPVDVAPLDAAGLPPGLVVWFPLDDATATNVADVVSGFGGTCSGSTCPAQTAGHRGTAFLFDGGDDCIQVADMGQFGQARITLSFWMRQDRMDDCSPFSKLVNLTSTSNTWQIETTSSEQISFTTTHSGDANSRVTASSAFTLAQWHHVAASYDGTMKRIYVDGVLVASGGQTSALLYNTQSAYIGCDNNAGSPALRFQGAIDEVQIYSRALSLAEIQMLAAM